MKYTICAYGDMEMICFAGDMTIEHEHALKSALITILGSSRRRIAINMEGVEIVDSSSLRLLCAAYRSSIQWNKSLLLIGVRPHVLHAAAVEATACRNINCAVGRSASCLWTGGRPVVPEGRA